MLAPCADRALAARVAARCQIFDVLACDDLVEWRLVAVVGSAAYNVVLLLALALACAAILSMACLSLT